MTQETPQIPWWLAGGTEPCPYCLQSHASGTELHCSGCDRVFCPYCSTAGSPAREALCPECGREAAGGF